MEVKNNITGLPLEHYGGLFRQGDPREMSGRCGVPYEAGAFRLTLLNRPVSVSWPEADIRWTDDGKEVSPYGRILLLRFLTGGRLALPSGKMLSYTETPWGDVYIRSFQGRVLSRLAFGFGRTPDKFRTACESIGGVPAGGTGISYRIDFLQDFTVQLILWEGEDDIPPAAQFLFSDNFPAAFSAEDLAVVGDLVVGALRGKW